MELWSLCSSAAVLTLQGHFQLGLRYDAMLYGTQLLMRGLLFLNELCLLMNLLYN